jgi:hypothetical protein
VGTNGILECKFLSKNAHRTIIVQLVLAEVSFDALKQACASSATGWRLHGLRPVPVMSLNAQNGVTTVSASLKLAATSDETMVGAHERTIRATHVFSPSHLFRLKLALKERAT